MSAENKIKLSELQHDFKIQNAKLKHVDLQIETLEAQRKLVELKLTGIQAEIITIKHGVQIDSKEEIKQTEAIATVDESNTFLDLNNDLELSLTEINSNSGEITLDLTQPTAIVPDEPKDVISSFIERLENELNEN